MRILGLTGPIASGKSAVGVFLRKKGAKVVDADAISREVAQPGSRVLARIIKEFGDRYLRPDGTLDREGLGSVVFADPEKKRRLEAITHPAIGAILAERILEARNQGVEIFIIEAILIMRSPMRPMLEGIIAVRANPDLRKKRLAERDGFSSDEIEKRIAAQRDLESEFDQAEYQIRNDGSLEVLAVAMDACWEEIEKNSPKS